MNEVPSSTRERCHIGENQAHALGKVGLTGKPWSEADVVNKGDRKEGVRFKKEKVVNRFGS